MIIVETENKKASPEERIAIYAHVSSVEHKDRLTRFGFRYLEALLELQSRTIEVVNLAENENEDLIADLVAIVYSRLLVHGPALGTASGETQDQAHCAGIESRWRMHEGTSLLTMIQLKERGWTAALVKKFLDPPDATRPNPHYKSASPMRLYTASRVEAAEKCEDWKTASTRARARCEVGKAAELVKEAEQLPITVMRLPLDRLRSRAIASYNAFHEELLWEREHDYERASEAMMTIRRRVYAEIAAHYPDYAQECQRQIRFRYGEAS